jgi:hypothetical protein
MNVRSISLTSRTPATPMKFKSLLLLAFVAVLTLAAPRPARAREVSFDFFYDSLSPYGEWLDVGDYGHCWRPTGVDEDWTPYSDGYWTYTDAGWTWVSYEDFGGIVYHYGRWVRVEDEGWCWVPDYEWGPAWVSWRRSDDYVGWAPLPAEATWQRERGISVWADTSYDIGPSHYNFCHTRDFGAPVLRPVMVRRSENIVILANTVNITNITYNTRAGCVFNGGLDYAYVNRFVPRPIPTLKLVRNQNITVVNNTIINNNVRITNFNAVPRGNQLVVIAPTVVRPQPAQLAALVQPKIVKVVSREKVGRGWSGVPEEQRVAMKAKFAQETQGRTPETAPAIPMKPAEIKMVPVKADPNAKLPVALRDKQLPKVVPTPMPESVTGNVPATVPGGAPLPPSVPVTKPPKTITGIPGRKITPPPVANVPSAGAIVTEPVERSKVPPANPGLIKPFKPSPNNPPVEGNVRLATPPPASIAIDPRKAAAAAAKNDAAAQAARQQRALENQNQQQEMQRRNQTQDAAVAKQRALQQQQDQQAVLRQRAAEQQQQQQEMLRRNGAQEAAAAKQRALQQQQDLQKAEARQRAVQQPPPQMPPNQQQIARQRAATVQPQPLPQRGLPTQPQVAVPQKVPAKNGKRPLTPEEAAKLQQQTQ